MVPRLPLAAFPAGSCPSPIDPPAPAYFGNASQAQLWEGARWEAQDGQCWAQLWLLAALPGLQQGWAGNNPHSAGECAGMAAGSHLLWVRDVVSDADKYIKNCCGKPFPVWSSVCCAV